MTTTTKSDEFDGETDKPENWNDYIIKKGYNNWQKVSKDNLPEKNTTNLIFFTRNGGIFCGHYKSNTKTFICYGINGKEILDVEVTHWRNELFPKEYQDYLDSLNAGSEASYPSVFQKNSH